MRNYDVRYCYLCSNYTTYDIEQDYSYYSFHVGMGVGVFLRYPSLQCICNICKRNGLYDETVNVIDNFIKDTFNDYVRLFGTDEIHKYRYEP